MGKFQILNHINPGKELGEMIQKRLGFSLSDVHDALKGNEQKIKELGIAAEQGRLITDNAEKIQQAVSEVIAGTATLAQVKGNVLKEAAKAGKVINKSLVDAHAANRDYTYHRDELALQFEQDNQYAMTGHQQRMQRLRSSHQVRMYVGQIDNQYQIDQTINSLQRKQIQENERYQRELNDHYLESGSKAKPQLINKKVYAEGEPASEGFVSKVKSLLSAVGL
jgi:hypothetical protein